MNAFRSELTPVQFLERSGTVHAERIAVVDGGVRHTWREFRSRARRLASALRAGGLEKGDRVAFLSFNAEPLLLAHFAVPMAGGVLVAINARWSAEDVAYVVEHAGATRLFVAAALEPLAARVAPRVRRIGTGVELESLIASGEDAPLESWLADESGPISINYSSGTTGRPKGVVYHHRGAYLDALAVALEHGMSYESVYAWTLPMYHCNGWTFPWALAAVGARSVCFPRVESAALWGLLENGVTHFCAAPTVLIMLANDPGARRLERPVRAIIGGAPPSPALIARLGELNFRLDHTYGLTETYGPFAINIPPPSSSAKPFDEQARIIARQGFPNVCAGEMRVVDPAMNDVPRDGRTMGEVVMRGNVVMSGYHRDPDATARAFEGGWLHTGDLAVWHEDGAVELRDRIKDVIISGGENISTIEVEQALASHPAVLECAVVAVPDETWGEVPRAFVTLREGAGATAAELISHCRTHLAHFKVPRTVVFGPLPKTSTGKIQKFVLREGAWKGREKRIN
ncbi:MAG: AMP-binding protein [Candidatus Krumholzibacteria bacterium]|nr:AMP-binding protein [Candidatus Krumholzibacteria bacterium]MDH4337503.1 AMP-binding protein [Candidatus Krumholzibacteria bacterium]MDH5268318.1 AMP-binding protein [Candidatus Krumholzibacteria bacterium]